jgi:DNA polymerase (family 10)
MEQFIHYDQVQQIVMQGPTRTTVILKNGLQVDVRVVPQKSYGAALLYFTGSKPHNIALRTTATRQGYKINEYGVFQGETQVAGKTEADIYQLLGYPYIEPELRENRGELEAALQDRLPPLITQDCIQGDLHAHTKASDGRNTIEEMAQAALAKGYEYLAITDHTQHTRVANGLDEKRYRKHLADIERVNDRMKGITILKSAEVDILEDGSLDLPDAILKQMDVVICSVHSHFNLSNAKQTDRVLRALDHPCVNIFCHPTGRLLNKREPYDIDLEKIMRRALQNGCYLELNAQPARLDLADTFCRMAKDLGLKLVISTDAHKVSDLDYMRFGIAQARRGWLEASNVINTRPLKEFRKLLKR